MADAYIVTFDHDGRSYNVWVWPVGGDGEPSASVNYRDGGGWTPIELDGGSMRPVEVQGSLFP